MKKKQAIYFLSPLILWLLGQSFLFFPTWFYSAIALGSLLIIFSVRSLAGVDRSRDWLLSVAPPLLFFLSFYWYVALIPNSFPNNLWIQLVFLLVLWFTFSYLRNLYYFRAYQAPNRLKKFDSLLASSGFLTVFAAASTLYGLPAFISWPFWILLLFIIPISALMFVQFRLLENNPASLGGPLVILNILILVELAWVFSLLPLNYNLLGFLLALVYAFLLLVWRLFNRGELKRSRLKGPVIISIIIVIILFLTANWL